MKKNTLIIIIVILLAAIAMAILTLTYTKVGNALIATNFVKNEDTYKYDGIPETFRLIENKTIELNKTVCSYCWEFYFEYDSRYSGYGDRTNTTLDQVITNHSARITMDKGKIDSAVLDDTWDMKNQKYAASYRPPRGQR